MVVERDVLVEWTVSDTFAGMKISWGGVFGGVLAGIGSLMLLTSLGIAIGISAVDPRDPNGSALGTGAAIWTDASRCSFRSSSEAGRRRGSACCGSEPSAMFEGALVWVLSLMLILYMAASGVSLVASGVLNIAGRDCANGGRSRRRFARRARHVVRLRR